MGEEARAVASDFVRERSELLWRRRQVVRAWGLLKGRGRKDYKPRRMYCFRDFEAQPEHFEVLFNHAGRPWVTVDHHCVNPDCRCVSVQLQFFACWKGGEVLNPEFVAFLDLATGAVEDPNGKQLTSRQVEVVRSLQDSLGDWHEEISLRRTLLTRIARRRLRFPAPAGPPGLETEAHAPSPPEGGPRPGRNDPCPCKSGRKYKKCCGR